MKLENKILKQKLDRDKVISMTDNGDLVGVYYKSKGHINEKILFECHPVIANEIIKLWNNKLSK